MPRVAVITPTYNRGANGLLEKTMLSVLGQTYRDFVHIIVDDESTDNTPNVVDKYASGDKRVVYFRRERTPQQKFGASPASNYGIGRLEEFPGAEFVTFLHSDDLYAKNNLERKVGALGAGTDLVYSWVGVFDRNSAIRIIKGPRKKEAADIASYIKRRKLVDFPYHTLLMSVRLLEKVGGFDEDVGYGEDKDFSTRVLDELEGRAVEIPEVLHYYRAHEDTIGQFYRQNGLVDNDLNYVFRKHCPSTVNRIVNIFFHPQNFMPEPIQKYLRVVRDKIKSRNHQFDIDPFVMQIETHKTEAA